MKNCRCTMAISAMAFRQGITLAGNSRIASLAETSGTRWRRPARRAGGSETVTPSVHDAPRPQHEPATPASRRRRPTPHRRARHPQTAQAPRIWTRLFSVRACDRFTANFGPLSMWGGAVSSLAQAIKAGRQEGKLALYFGCLNGLGHFLHGPGGMGEREALQSKPPWSMALMDGDLLKNGRRPDVYDGKVYWTCGGAAAFWYAFYWWDRSKDHRGASNSGFYVRGFGWPEAQEAFDYACSVYPKIVARQHHPLTLQDPTPPHENLLAAQEGRLV